MENLGLRTITGFLATLTLVHGAYAQDLTFSQSNALRSAENYLTFMPFSRLGLIDQLASPFADSYERADAEVAVNSMVVDWNEQAANSARNYLEMMGFSCRGLIDQLSSSAGDKYTKAQATYGARKAGVC